MAPRVVQTSKRLAAERQIHSAIVHFHAGDFECAISLCSAAEGQMPEPDRTTHFFAVLKNVGVSHPAPDGQKDDFNFVANWMKHGGGADQVQIEAWMVLMWLNRAISKYRAVFGAGTPAMTAFYPWAAPAADV